MGRNLALLSLLWLAGCAYVTKKEYDGYWDKDQDGWPIGEDCDDLDPAVFPYAPDPRGDGCDSDCSMEPDADGDDWPDDADCAKDDAAIHPCNIDEVDGDTVDSDCDGKDGVNPESCRSADPDFPDEPPITDCGDASEE